MSIRRRLLWGMLLGIVTLFAISGTLFHNYIHTVLTRQFNSALAAKAQALCSLIKLQSNGEVELELSQQQISKLDANASFEYFQIWRGRGENVLMRSPALGMTDLPNTVADAPVLKDIDLPNGRPGRAIVLCFQPITEDENMSDNATTQEQKTPISSRELTVSVAQDRSELDRVMALLLSALLLVAVFMVTGTVVVVSFVVWQGLQPLQMVAYKADHIDVQSLHVRFSLDGLPSELRPICLRLNDSLERLQQAFQRERRFTADVAHELRTPIAELRSLADVALKWQGDPETSLSYFKDAQDIARQMEDIVTTLLVLARCQSETIAILRESVDVGETVKEVWRKCGQKPAERKLVVTFNISSPMVIETDRTMLYSIIGNLLNNAVEYAPIGGAVSCDVQCVNSATKLIITNDANFLSPDDLPHLFEAFWRKDPARTDGFHCGLGLTLVDAYTRLLGGSVAVSMPTQESLRVAVELPAYIKKR